MPNVPILNRPQVSTSPLPRVRTQAGAEGIIPTVALNVASGVLDVFERERQSALDVRINAAEVEARDLRTRIESDPKKGILNRRGTDALSAPDDAESEWATGISEIEAKLSDPDAREVFRARADQLRSELRATAMRHAGRESEAMDAPNTKTLIEDSIERIADVAGDNAAVNQNIEQAAQLLDGLLRRQGKPKDVREAEVRVVRSQARAAQLLALANTENAERIAQARDIFAKESAGMTERDRENTERALDDAGSREQAQRISGELLLAHPDDEAAALVAARERLSGKDEDEVVNRIRDRFAEQRRLKAQTVNDAVNEGVAAVERGEGVPSAVRDILLANDPQKLSLLRTRASQVARGVPIETDSETYATLFLMEPQDLAQVNPNDYVTKLSEPDFQELTRAVRDAKTGVAGRAMSRGDLATELLSRAQQDGLVDASVRTLADLNRFKPAKAAFNRLNNALTSALLEAQNVKGFPLNGQEQRAVLNQILDDEVMATGFVGMAKGTVPRAFAEPRRFRELNTDELAARRLPFEVRVQQLRAEGLTKEQARARMAQEGYPEATEP